MHWILQLDLEAGHSEEVFLEAIQEQGLPHTCVKVVPFSHELVPEPEVEGKVVCYGGTVLKQIAQERGWKPGVYLNSNFDFESWRGNWGSLMLNHEAYVKEFGQVSKVWDRLFIRPCESDKTFTGVTLYWDEFEKWREEVASGKKSHLHQDLTMDTLVCYAPYKHIEVECRFFIVDGKIVTGSFYRIRGMRQRVPFFNSPWYNEHMEWFVESAIRQWSPAEAFVIDVAQTEQYDPKAYYEEVVGKYKIIEVNTLNSSGLYECSPSAIVKAVEDMER